MKMPSALVSRWLLSATLASCWLASALSVHAQAPGTGSIQGRVFNPATGEYVRNAEIRLQGTDRVVYSEEGGSYRMDQVPAGSAALEVAFSGYHTVTAAVNVAAGATVTRDFELVSTLLAAPGAGGDVLKLGAFVVSNALQIGGPWLGFLRGLFVAGGVLVTIGAVLVGLGAVLITRGGRRPEFYGGLDFFDERRDMDAGGGAESGAV